jgi:hypothetical protein
VARVEVRGQLGDLVAEPVQLRGVLSSKRMDLHGELSFYCSDSTPRFLGVRRASETGDHGMRNDFDRASPDRVPVDSSGRWAGNC